MGNPLWLDYRNTIYFSIRFGNYKSCSWDLQQKNLLILNALLIYFLQFYKAYLTGNRLHITINCHCKMNFHSVNLPSFIPTRPLCLYIPTIVPTHSIELLIVSTQMMFQFVLWLHQ